MREADASSGGRSRWSIPTLAAVGAASTLFAAFITWPQALNIGTTVVSHDDPLFSMWRLSWIAHALVRAPTHLLDGNIFYPAANTLTFSDATLLEAAIAAPLLWGGVPAPAAYNILLLGGIAACGVGMFVLAREVIGRTGPALVSAAIFTMAPYRVEHIMHLELQWAMWIPLTFWALHRLVARPSSSAGALVGVLLFLQTVSCVYYGVFLALASVGLVLLLACARPRQTLGAVPSLAVSIGVAVALISPYGWPYLKTARLLGPRGLAEVGTLSASGISYLTAPPQSWLWGWTSKRWGGPETRLYLGVVACMLALAGAAYRPRRVVFVYAALAALAIELSFGTNGWLYSTLAGIGLQGLRSPSRAAIVVHCAVAVIAGFGVRAIQERSRPTFASYTVPVVLLLVTLDYANKGMPLMTAENPNEAPLYRVLRSSGRGVVVELPLPAPDRLPGSDARFEFWSTSHWFPLVNGYSGYYTPEYLRTLDAMRTFPDDEPIARLKRIGVRYIVLHHAFYSPDGYTSLLLQIGRRPELHFYGTYKDPISTADIFLLQ
jgi:hypothetical protein